MGMICREEVGEGEGEEGEGEVVQVEVGGVVVGLEVDDLLK